MNKQRRLKFLIPGLLVVGIGFWLLSHVFFNTSYTFTIVSDTDAQISVASSSNNSFQELGIGTVKYTTKQSEPVYVQVRKNSSVSMQTVNPKISNNTTVSLSLIDTKNVTALLEIPISSSYSEDGQVYGVNELTNSMINFSLADFVPPKLSFISVPYVNKVTWLDSNNFHYNILRGGVGSVIGGKNKSTAFLNDRLSPLSEAEAVLDINKPTQKAPLALLSSSALYTSTDFGGSLKKVADVGFSENTYFTSDDSYIYLGFGLSASAFASEDGEEVVIDASKDEAVSTLVVYDYGGQILSESKLSGVGTISSVARHPSVGIFVVVDSGILQLDNSGNITTSYSFPFVVNDVVSYNNNVYVLSDKSIWLLNLKSSTYSLVSDLGGNVYIANTSFVEPDEGNLVLTTINVSATSGAQISISLD